MDVVVLVRLTNGTEGFTEISSVIVLAGLMYVGKDDQDLFVGITSERVRGELGDVEPELLHVLLEALAPVEKVWSAAILMRSISFSTGRFAAAETATKS